MSTDLMDAVLYSKYHDLSQRDVCEFFKLCSSLLDWKDLSQDLIMDIGCGPGNTSSKWLLNLFPEISKLIAVDVSESMIKQARLLNPNPKIEYCIADISNKQSLEVWEGKISKIVSTWCFHWLSDTKSAFQNVFSLLKPGGEAVLLSKLPSHYTPYECCQDMSVNSKWSKYAKGADYEMPETYFKKWNASHYEKIVREVGFEVILCKQEDKTFTFETDDDCIGFCMGVLPLMLLIPDELKEEFAKDFFYNFMKQNERDSSGRPIIGYSVIHLLLKKPEKTDVIIVSG